MQTDWQTMYILNGWLLWKPYDLDLHCLQGKTNLGLEKKTLKNELDLLQVK